MSENSAKNTIKGHRLFRKGDRLAVTISPGMSLQFWKPRKSKSFYSPSERKIEFIKYWDKVFKDLAGFDYTFVLETSRFGLLHFHGTVLVKDPFLTANMFGRLKYFNELNIDVDTIDDPRTWEEYCYKDCDINQIVLTRKTKIKTTIMDYLSD